MKSFKKSGRERNTYLFFILFFFSLGVMQAGTSRINQGKYKSFREAFKAGEDNLKQGYFPAAIDAFREAFHFAGNHNHREEELRCLLKLGILLWNTGQLEESRNKFKTALSYSKELGKKTDQDIILSYIKIHDFYDEAKNHRSSGRHEDAISCFQRAIDLSKKVKSSEHEVKCLRQLSFVYWQENNLQEFLSLNLAALKIAQMINHLQEEGRCLNNVGLAYLKEDNFSKALYHLERALRIARDLGEIRDEADCLNNIGTMYISLGDYDKALDCFNKIIKINNKINDIYSLSLAMNNIGEIFRNRGLLFENKNDLFSSLEYYFQCLSLVKQEDRKTEVQVLNNIGIVYISLGDNDNAIKYFNEAYNKAKIINDTEALGMIFINMGYSYFKLKKYEKARNNFEFGVDLAIKTKSNQILWEAYFRLGQCYEKLGNNPQAVSYYKSAIDVIDYVRRNIALDTQKAGFARDKLRVYECLIDLLSRLKATESTGRYDKDIFFTIERAKARAFLESLGGASVDIQMQIRPELRKRENEISNKISAMMTEISGSNITQHEREVLLDRLNEAEEEYLNLMSQMRVESPEIFGLVSPRVRGTEEVQRRILDEKTALVEYFLGEDRSYGLLMTKDTFFLKVLPSRQEIESSLKAYLKLLSTPPEGKFKGILAAKRISKEYFSFVEEQISDSIQRLIIIPDGIFHCLPFETLVCVQSDLSHEDSFLIEKYTISYAPSSSSLFFLMDSKSELEDQKYLLAVGNPVYPAKSSKRGGKIKSYGETLREIYINLGFDFSPLPFTGKEILGISKYFPKKGTDVYLGAKAKEEIVKDIPLKEYQIIHFACHGLLDEKFPFRSALVLTLDEDEKEDGFLQVREIHNLRMNANLVVLSACQTGKGILERGEGILGLPRIFFYTGARSVVSTLWRINDRSTAQFMKSFYRHLSKGKGKAEALRLAKIDVIRSRYSHPFYWAAFILNGEFKEAIHFH